MKNSRSKAMLAVLALLVVVSVVLGIWFGNRGDTKRPLIVSNIETGSGRAYFLVENGLRPSVQQYTDRYYRFTSVPRDLVGATYLRTANDDKSSRGPGFLTFEINQSATVYVAHDRKIRDKPAWLREWERSESTLHCDDLETQGYDLFRRRFDAGRVSLPGNVEHATSACMYTVLLVPTEDQNLPPVVVAGMDRIVRLPDGKLLLDGAAYDDGRSEDEISVDWMVLSGPGPVVFSAPESAVTDARFSKEGRYELQFRASDGEKASTDNVLVEVLPAAEPFELARKNAARVREGLERAHAFLQGWLSVRDERTGLVPRALQGEGEWRLKDTAADIYPFLVLAAEITDPEAFRGACLDMLRAERRVTARLGKLPDDWSLTRNTFSNSEMDIGRMQFGTAEYIKDGLIAITEWLGDSPWKERMIELMDACWEHAPIDTPFGKIVSNNVENNGEMLQVLPRLYYMTGDEKYLNWALRLADYYLLGENHPTRDLDELRLRDHGCEILSGLCELYACCAFAAPEKRKQYKKPLYQMLDRVLQVGINADGLFHEIIKPKTGEVVFGRLGDNFGYNYNGYYSVFLVDGHEPYRDAAKRVLSALYRYPAFHGGEPMDGLCDSIECVLYLTNREPYPNMDVWLDDAVRTLWSKQKPSGRIDDMYLDGNFARTTLLYCLYKSQGALLRPWRSDVGVGASRSGSTLQIYAAAEKQWTGRLHLDSARHKEHLKLPLNWTRINQFSPEWTTIEPGVTYTVRNADSGTRRTVPGRELLQGLPLEIQAGGEVRLEISWEPGQKGR